MPYFHLTTTPAFQERILEEAFAFLSADLSFSRCTGNIVFLNDYPLNWKEFTTSYAPVDVNIFPANFSSKNVISSESSEDDDDDQKKALFIFDLDSTLIQMECIDELARIAMKHKECSSITERAMRGELDFKESLFQRIKLLKGLKARESFEKVISSLPLSKGIQEFISTIRNNIPASKMFICSGGFAPIAEEVARLLGMDGTFSNELEVVDNLFTGRLVNYSNVVDSEFKRKKLISLRDKFSIPSNRVVAIGDGSNDLQMMKEAGLCGVAFGAKELVRRQSKVELNSGNFEDLLHIMGF